MKWFQHESGAKDSLRLKRLRAKYGAEGYGLYWYLVECIAETWESHGADLHPEAELEDIIAELRIVSGQAPDMIRWMIEKGLFEASELGLVRCESLRSHIGEAQRKAERREKLKLNSGQAPDSVRTDSGKKRQSRVEESRVETSANAEVECVSPDSPPSSPSLFPGEESLSPGREASKKKRAPLAEKPDPWCWAPFAEVYPGFRLMPCKAAKEWLRRNCPDTEEGRRLFGLIVGKVVQWKKSEQWIQGKVPNCSKFLDERIWEGEPGPPPYRSVQERQDGNREAVEGARRILGFGKEVRDV